MPQTQLDSNHQDIADVITSLIALLQRNVQVGFRQEIIIAQRIHYRELFRNLFLALKPYVYGNAQNANDELEAHFSDLYNSVEPAFALENPENPPQRYFPHP